MKHPQHSLEWLYYVIIALCLFPFISPPLALGIGIILSLLKIQSPKFTNHTSAILQYSVVLMGFGMNLKDVLNTSRTGFTETIISVTSVMFLGLLLGKIFKAEKNTSILIAAGTAICGGSAIAAVAPILQSKSHQNSLALGVVFILNAAALLIFPHIGHYLGLSQEVFGNWAAIAIHDTSSVVGAGAVYGPVALQVATTVKLIRALWIIPLSFVIAFFNKNCSSQKIKYPLFILIFLFVILFTNSFPSLGESYIHLSWLGRRGMVIALFLIGSNISLAQIKQSGIRSFALGITLWMITSIVSLIIISSGII